MKYVHQAEKYYETLLKNIQFELDGASAANHQEAVIFWTFEKRKVSMIYADMLRNK